MNLLEVKDLTITDSKNGEVVVEKNNFILKKNSCLGIVGESGSGKSMTVKAILGLTNPWLKITGSALFDGQELDLVDIIEQTLDFKIPASVLCKEDCKGLCPVCGQNLNTKSCDCEDTGLDPRMSVVRDLFKNFKEV